jgi:hypothetical protein
MANPPMVAAPFPLHSSDVQQRARIESSLKKEIEEARASTREIPVRTTADFDGDGRPDNVEFVLAEVSPWNPSKQVVT